MKTLIIGEASSGKTAYLLTIAKNEAMVGNQVIMYTGESPSYISELNKKLNYSKNSVITGNIVVIHGRTSLETITSNLFNGNKFDTVLIDGLQYLLDIEDSNECYTKLNDLLHMPRTNVYLTLPSRKNHEPNSSAWLWSTVDRVLELSSSKKEVKILKSRTGKTGTFPIELF